MTATVGRDAARMKSPVRNQKTRDDSLGTYRLVFASPRGYSLPVFPPCPAPGDRSESSAGSVDLTKHRWRLGAIAPWDLVLTYDAIAKRIDHSLLGPTLTDAELEAGCRLAAEYRVASVCIKPYAVALAAATAPRDRASRSGPRSGFPHGGHATAVKVFEAERAMDDGATELDMVINIGQALGGRLGRGRRRHRGRDRGRPRRRRDRQGDLRELLPRTTSRRSGSARSAARSGPTTSRPRPATGPAAPTHADLILMRKTAPPHVKLKAAGGVRDLDRRDRRRRAGLRPDRGRARRPRSSTS